MVHPGRRYGISSSPAPLTRCHLKPEPPVLSPQPMTPDRRRQLHNLTHTVDASPRASKINTVSRALETFRPLNRDRRVYLMLRRAIRIRAASIVSPSRHGSGCIFVFTDQTSCFRRMLAKTLDITVYYVCTDQGSHAGRPLARPLLSDRTDLQLETHSIPASWHFTVPANSFARNRIQKTNNEQHNRQSTR
jgi:hypothetical protein